MEAEATAEDESAKTKDAEGGRDRLYGGRVMRAKAEGLGHYNESTKAGEAAGKGGERGGKRGAEKVDDLARKSSSG